MRYRMGDLVELVTETNSDLKYGLDDIVGVTLEKQMIPTIANLTQTNLDDFIIVHPKDFVYNPRTHGKKIGLGFNTTDSCFISTWNNNTFRVKPNMLDTIIPEYLYMHFLRERWDKEACFNAWGSSTVVLLWSSFCDMKINVPPISEQRKIVHDYQVITDRIELLRKMNENLENQAYTLFQQTIDGFEKDGVLSDLAVITMGTSPEGETMNSVGEGEVFYQGRTDFGFRFPTVRLYTTDAVRRAKCGDVLMSVRAPVGDINIAKEDCAIGRGLASIRPKDKCYSFMYYTMKALYFELQRFNDEGTVFGAITKDDLANQKVILLGPADRKAFDNKAKVLDACIRNNEFEVFALQTLRDNLLSGLAKGA